MLETCSDLMREAYKRNWITARDGNISIRWHDRDHFWITPSAIRKPDLQPAMWKKMIVEEQDGKKTTRVVPYTDISLGLSPSGELPLHFGLQKTLPNSIETRVVVHLHPTYTIAAMHKGLSLENLSFDFPELSRYTAVGKSVPDVLPISEELGEKGCKNLGLDDTGALKYDIIGIKGHGVVAVDETPWRAFEHIERLEHICKIVLASSK